jgi:hypothetical protein
MIIFARLFTMSGRNPTQMYRSVTKRSRWGVKGGRNGFIGDGASQRIVSRASMSVNLGGDYVQGLAQIGKAREKGPLAAALPLDIPPEGIDHSPPQEISNDTVHRAGNNFPILDAPTTRSNRNFRSTGGLGSRRDEHDLSTSVQEKGLAAFATEHTVCAGSPLGTGNLGTNKSKGEIYYAVLAERLDFSLVCPPFFSLLV